MKKIMSLLLAAVLVLGLTACGSKPVETQAPTEPATEAGTQAETEPAPTDETFETVALNVAYMPNMGSCSLAITAKNQGYFEQMGLDVTLKEFQGGPAEIAAMASGEIQISQIGHGAHALCAEGEAVIFQLDCTSLADAVVGNKDKGVNSIEDLKGKTVAVTSGTSAEIILNLALQSVGLTMDDIEAVEMDANGIVTAMVSGSVDACATWSPGTGTIMNGLGDKAIMLADNSDYLDQVTFPSSFITTQAYADENHDVLVRFARALQLAADYRNANIEEVAGFVADQCQVEKDTMLACVGEGNWTLTSDFYGTAVADGTVKSYYENQQKVFLDGGRLTEEVPVENYVLFDVMQEAYDANHK